MSRPHPERNRRLAALAVGTTLVLTGIVGVATPAAADVLDGTSPLDVVSELLQPQAQGSQSSTGTAARSSSSAKALVGVLRITGGRCGSAGVTSGSSFAMITKDGSGYVANGDSPCGDKNVTPMRPGRDGGLSTTRYQPQGRDGITAATTWFGTPFRLSSNATDPQSGKRAALPSVQVSGTRLTGQTSAISANWNGSDFNQGSPKPDGTSPGRTKAVTGTYNATTRAFSLDWQSGIVGGPFDGFTGKWHLEGTFVPTSSGASKQSGSVPHSTAPQPVAQPQVPLTGFPITEVALYALAILALGVNVLAHGTVSSRGARP